jgi:hypothetical protein
LPPQRVKDFRRYYGWRDALIEAVREGARSRRSLLLLVDQWIADDDQAARHPLWPLWRWFDELEQRKQAPVLGQCAIAAGAVSA